MVLAIGLVASQPVGLREVIRLMNKSFKPGRAAEQWHFRGVAGIQELHVL